MIQFIIIFLSLVNSGENTTTVNSGFGNIKEVEMTQDEGPITGNTGQLPPPPFN